MPLRRSPLYEELLTSGRVSNEEDYLNGLEHGYYIGCPLRINLTQFSDEELLAHKLRMSNQVRADYQAYVRKHLAELMKYIRIGSNMLNIEGYSGFLRKFLQFVRRHIYKKAY